MTAQHLLSKQVRDTLDSLWKLEQIILNSLDFHKGIQEVVNSILKELEKLDEGYNSVSLFLIDDTNKFLKEVAITKESHKKDHPFKDLTIDLKLGDNSCVNVINERKSVISHELSDILPNTISADEIKQIQHQNKIKTLLVYPLLYRNECVGVMIFTLETKITQIEADEEMLIQYLTDLVALAVQNSKTYYELQSKQRHLELSNKKLKLLDNAKDEFISITSHELKTPMSIVKSYLWMLDQEKGGKLNPKQKEYVQRAQSGTDRMLDLINNMLNVSRIEQQKITFKFEKISLTEKVPDMFNVFEARANEKKLKLSLEIDDNVNYVYTDERRLREIIGNLVTNAIKYTDSGSIKLKISKEDNYFVKLSVIDTGRGIEPEEAKKLFHKFQRLDNSYQAVAEVGGTGLGLYIVRLYISNMGGSIGVDSKGKGQGSTFWVTLPTKKSQIVDSYK